MTFSELNGKYARLRDEIDSLGGTGVYSKARLARLMAELDRIDLDLAAFRHRALHAPTLRDVVGWDVIVRQRVAQHGTVQDSAAQRTARPRLTLVPARAAKAA